MGRRDPRIDAYIAKRQPFAKPILTHLRAVVHSACPDVEETIKWGFPHFQYKGMLCSMAAFKEHATFGFWKGRHIVPEAERAQEAAMGQFGRITSVKELPAKKVIAGYVKAAMKRNEMPVKKPAAPKPRVAKPVVVPAVLQKALAKNAKARAFFQSLSPSQKREYTEWITEAKREETAAKRLQTTIEWLAEGKVRQWKYQNC